MKIIRHKGILFLLLLCGLTVVPKVHGQEGLRPGTRAPNFDLPAISGTRITLSTFLTKNIIILHFWKSK